MKKSKILSGVLLICLSLLSFHTTALADDTSAEERWKQLPESEKVRIRESYQRWKQMGEGDRERLKQSYRRFRTLSAAKQASVWERFKRFRNLPPKQKQEIRQRYRDFMKLDPKVRAERIQQMRERRMQLRNGAPGRPNRDRMRPPMRQRRNR